MKSKQIMNTLRWFCVNHSLYELITIHCVLFLIEFNQQKETRIRVQRNEIFYIFDTIYYRVDYSKSTILFLCRHWTNCYEFVIVFIFDGVYERCDVITCNASVSYCFGCLSNTTCFGQWHEMRYNKYGNTQNRNKVIDPVSFPYTVNRDPMRIIERFFIIFLLFSFLFVCLIAWLPLLNDYCRILILFPPFMPIYIFSLLLFFFTKFANAFQLIKTISFDTVV